MKLTREQKQALRDDFKALTPQKKAEYIFDYYKWHIILCVIFAAIVVSVVVRAATKKNETLYLAAVNVSFGSETEAVLTRDFIDAEELDPKRNEVYVYSALYLSENPSELDHEYAYASRMKLMAAVNAEKMDVFLMNRESYDLLSGSGYLAELDHVLPQELLNAISGELVENEVIIEDNNLEVLLNEADERETVTETCVNAVVVSGLDSLKSAGFEDEVYLGVAVNSPRIETAAEYISYLAGRK